MEQESRVSYEDGNCISLLFREGSECRHANSICFVWIPWPISLCFPDLQRKLHQMRSYDHVKYLSVPSAKRLETEERVSSSSYSVFS